MNYLCQLFQKFWLENPLPCLSELGFLHLYSRQIRLDLCLHEILYLDLKPIILNFKSSLNLYLMIVFLLQFHFGMNIAKNFIFFMIIVKSFHFKLIIFKVFLDSINVLNFHFSIIIIEKYYIFVTNLLNDL